MWLIFSRFLFVFDRLPTTTKSNNNNKAAVGASGVVFVSKETFLEHVLWCIVSYNAFMFFFITGNLSQRPTTKESSTENSMGDESQDCKMSAKSVVIGNVVEKNLNQEPTTPKLMNEPEETVDDGDKKPAAKPKSDKENIVVVVTMQEATYSNERMIEALVRIHTVLVVLICKRVVYMCVCR